MEDKTAKRMMEEARVIAQERLGTEYRKLTLAAPGVAAAAAPGQFVHLRMPGLDAHLLRRPFSLHRAKDGHVVILYKTVGTGTKAMNGLRPGDTVSLLGPLGRGFPLESGGGLPVLIGGGYGAAPLFFLAERLGRKGVVFLGGRTAADLLCEEDFEWLGWEVRTATEDGSRGGKGLVTEVLDRWLADRNEPATEWFACGPDGMMRALGECALKMGVRAWLSMDRHMGCGAGVCLACVIRVRVPGPDGGEAWARVCKDGPVFESREIVWNGGAA